MAMLLIGKQQQIRDLWFLQRISIRSLHPMFLYRTTL